MIGALEQIAALIHRESGIVIRAAQFDALAATLGRSEPHCNPDESLRRLSDPVPGPGRLARLVDEVTVKETFFLRHHQQLEEIQWRALLCQARASGSGSVRVWSAGCATGEEAYSLALLACEAFGTLEPPVEIIATDVSATALACAEVGEYRARSTRELDSARRTRYFAQRHDRLVVDDPLRALVSFARHNLVNEPAPPFGLPAFDLILCRNVLIYFDERTVDRVVSSLRGALAPSGSLILGAADALCAGAGRLQALAAAAGTPPHRPAVTERRPLRRPLGRLGSHADRSDPPAPADPALPLDPLGPTADFLLGLAELEASNPRAAVTALRRTLYADPSFGLAAFQLGRCYEALERPDAARRAYEQALRTLRPDTEHRQEELLEQVDLEDVRAATAARIDALAPHRR